MSEWRGLHNLDFHVELNSYSIHCDYCACPCRRDLMCRCCGQAEVERLTEALADRDRRIAEALNLHYSQCCKLEPPCMEAAILLGQYTLRGES